MRLQYYCMSHPGATLGSFMEPHPVLNGNQWVTQPLSMGGEIGIWAPERTMEDVLVPMDGRTPDLESEWGIEKLRQSEELASLFEIAGDGDGNRYYLSAVSRRFYIWSHDSPEGVALCNIEGDHFFDWLVEQYPEQPTGRPWTTFSVIPKAEPVKVSNGEEISLRLGNTTGFGYAHSTCFPLAELEALASKIFSDPVVYRNEDSYSAIDPARPLLVEALHNHRGFYTYLHLSANNRAVADKDLVARVVLFQKALLATGFCHPDSRELSRISSEFL